MKSTPILVIAGYSGTGKTTLIERLLPELARRGHCVGVVKQVGHAMQFDKSGKDSDRFWRAGAEAVGVVSGERIVLMQRARGEIDLQAMADQMGVDLVLAEGFKHSDWPKLLVAGDDVQAAISLGHRSQVIGIVSSSAHNFPWPRFSHDDINSIAACIEQWLRRQQASVPE